ISGRRSSRRPPSSARLWRNDFYVELFQQRWVRGAGRAEHQVLMALRLRKRHHVADVLGAEDGHHQPVDPGRDASVWRHSVLERVEQVAELSADLIAAETQDLEDALLQLTVVDADASA